MTHQPVHVVSQCSLTPGWWLASGDQRRLTGSGRIKDMFVTMRYTNGRVYFTLLYILIRKVWLYWLTRCGPQPLQRISASCYRPVHHLGLCALPMLVVPRIHTELARRAFSVAAPSTWNSLPADIRLCESILTFKRHLKTHLFKLT